MDIRFLGATGTVTGSKYLVNAGGRQILIDCGLFQGVKQLRLKNWARLPVDPREIDAVILTHAHIDHSGYLPLLVKSGFRGRMYGTAATAEGAPAGRGCRICHRGFSRHHPALSWCTEDDAKETCTRSSRGNPQGNLYFDRHAPASADAPACCPRSGASGSRTKPATPRLDRGIPSASGAQCPCGSRCRSCLRPSRSCAACSCSSSACRRSSLRNRGNCGTRVNWSTP